MFHRMRKYLITTVGPSASGNSIQFRSDEVFVRGGIKTPAQLLEIQTELQQQAGHSDLTIVAFSPFGRCGRTANLKRS